MPLSLENVNPIGNVRRLMLDVNLLRLHLSVNRLQVTSYYIDLYNLRYIDLSRAVVVWRSGMPRIHLALCTSAPITRESYPSSEEQALPRSSLPYLLWNGPPGRFQTSCLAKVSPWHNRCKKYSSSLQNLHMQGLP